VIPSPDREAQLLERWRSATGDSAKADAAHRLAAHYSRQGDTGESERFAREAIRAEERCARPALLGNHLMFLADLVRQHGATAEPFELVTRALSCYEAAHGPDHREVAYVLGVLAGHCDVLGLDDAAAEHRARQQRILSDRS